MRTNYYLLSDTHLGHRKYITEEQEESIISQLSVIRECDFFIHLGDVAFYDVENQHKRLLGAIAANRKFLVLGNHDRDTLTAYYRFGWTIVCNEFKLNIYGKVFLFTHEPVDKREDFDINVHGHLHDDTHRSSGDLKDYQRLVFTKLQKLNL